MLESYIRQYLTDYRPFKPYWNYEDGCVLLGAQRLYEATGDRFYAQCVLDYLEQRVQPDGSIPCYPAARHSLDSFLCSRALYFAYALTGDIRYRRAVTWQAAQLAEHPRTPSGLYWHKQIYPEQVWIDGTFMLIPFFAEYAVFSGDESVYAEIGRWFAGVRQMLYVPETGLYVHAADESRTQAWADPETGRSGAHWLRGESWLLMALTDTLALLPEQAPALRLQLRTQLAEAVGGLMQYRRPDGLLLQVINRADLAGNYPETSGNLMTACALLRAAANGDLPKGFLPLETGLRMLEAVKANALTESENSVTLGGICASAGLGGTPFRDGSPAYYLSEPAVAGDPKGVGALMMAEAAKTVCLRAACPHRAIG